MNTSKVSVKISLENRDKLIKLMGGRETYDDVITRLLNTHPRVNEYLREVELEGENRGP